MKKWYNLFWGVLLLLPWLFAIVVLRSDPTLAFSDAYSAFYADGLLNQGEIFRLMRDAFSIILGPNNAIIFPLHWAFCVFTLKLVFDLLTIVPRMLGELGKRWFEGGSEL